MTSPAGLTVVHPTDLSPDSHVAFAHALKLALAGRGKLKIMHVEAGAAEVDWDNFPQVRATLARWGLLPPGSSREDVVKLGLGVEKIVFPGEKPASAIPEYLRQRHVDLMVLATHQRDGLDRWFAESVAEPLARRSRVRTLFVPGSRPGFTSLADGSITFKRVLIPIDGVPSPQYAIRAAAELAQLLEQGQVAFQLLHIGDRMPTVGVPERSGWSWDRVLRTGDVVAEILGVAAHDAVDLIVMATQGHRGVLDALRGSTTERVVRGSACPVLAVPAVEAE
ncbi:MAG TPA: universal stress protein [Nitrospiraceae bacterium]|jgi:nucleotide-binding universal stress UspA family protein|nr:universal stress protein [Nitrospiraceae bacterium]